MREGKANLVTGNLINSICFSGFDPEKSSFYTIADNLNGFLSFDGLPNALNRRCRALQIKLALAEVFLENKASFQKSCIAVQNKQKLSRKRKLKENENDDKSVNCNMNLVDKKENKNTRKSLEFRKTLKMGFFCGKKDDPKNLHKCQTLELHNHVKNATQNLNDFNLIAKLSEGDMMASDAKYHLICLTSLYRRGKKINHTHCDEPVDEQIRKGTLIFSFRNTASTKVEVSTLTNPAPVNNYHFTFSNTPTKFLPYKRFCKNFGSVLYNVAKMGEN